MHTGPTKIAIEIDRLIAVAYGEGLRLNQEGITASINVIAPLWNGVTACIVTEGNSTRHSIIKNGVVVYSFSEIYEGDAPVLNPKQFVHLIKNAEYHVTH